jgi:hypothetical protein
MIPVNRIHIEKANEVEEMIRHIVKTHEKGIDGLIINTDWEKQKYFRYFMLKTIAECELFKNLLEEYKSNGWKINILKVDHDVNYVWIKFSQKENS